MRHSRTSGWPLLSALLALVLLGGTALPGLGQAVDSPTTVITIESPTNGGTLQVGDAVIFSGWAVDTTAPEDGIAAVEIYVDGTSIGQAIYGDPRPDVASLLGSSDFANVGYDLTWTGRMAPGSHTATVWVQSASGDWSSQSVTLHVASPPAPAAAYTPPASPSPAAAVPAPGAPPTGSQGSSSASSSTSRAQGSTSSSSTAQSTGSSSYYPSASGQTFGGASAGSPPFGGGYGAGPGGPQGLGSPFGAAGAPGGFGMSPAGAPPTGAYGAYGAPYAGAGAAYGVGAYPYSAPAGASPYGAYPYADPALAGSYGAYGSYYAGSASAYPVAGQAAYYGYPYATTSYAASAYATYPYSYGATYPYAYATTAICPSATTSTAYPYYTGYPYYTAASPLAAPTGVSAVATAPTAATLSWAATSGATSYEVCQAPSAAGPFTLVMTSATPTATVSNLSPGITYYFEVLAVSALGPSTPSTAVVVSTPATGTVAGSPPTSVGVLGATTTTATLTWAPSSGATYYLVYQSPTPSGPFTQSAVGLLSGSTATVSGLVPGTTYYFQVLAVNANGVQSTPSAVVVVTTPLA